MERDNRRVEIVVDLSELRAVAGAEPYAADGSPRNFSDVLALFKNAGVTSVSCDEDTIGGLELSHRLNILPTTDRSLTLLQPLTEEEEVRIVDAIRAKTGFPVDLLAAPNPAATKHARHRHAVPANADAVGATAGAPPSTLAVQEPIAVVRTIGLGIDPSVSGLVQSAGLHIVGRVSNYSGVSQPGIDWTLDNLGRSGAGTVIFSGEDVLGYTGPLPAGHPNPNYLTVAEGLKRNHLSYGAVEFGKTLGDLELQNKAQESTVRVHTILGTEMPTMDMPSAVQRFLLAARERNIRVLFVRLFLSEPQPVQQNTRYIHDIAQGLLHARPTALTVGPAHGFPPLQSNRILRFVMGLGVAAGWLLLLDAVTRIFAGKLNPYAVGFALLVALVLLVLPLTTGFTGPKLAALAAGCIFPTLALLHTDPLRSESGLGLHPLVIVLVRFTSAIAITAIGIVELVGLLADRHFLLKTDDFLGVKAVAIAPALVVALVYGLSLRATERRSFGQALEEAGERIARAGRNPITLNQAAIALAAVAICVLIVMRSGNDPGVGVSPLELRFRSLLDLLLPARPRFKDLLGHPALLIAFTFAARGYRKAAYPLLLLGAIGLSSMLDAFCHVHTPIPVALTRDVLAIVISLIVYLVLYVFVLRPLLHRLRPAQAA